MKRNFWGFSLIELIVVVVILLILAAIAIPLYQNYAASSRVSSAATDVRHVSDAAQRTQTTLTLLPNNYTGGAPVNTGAEGLATTNWVAADWLNGAAQPNNWAQYVPSLGSYPTGPSAWPACASCGPNSKVLIQTFQRTLAAGDAPGQGTAGTLVTTATWPPTSGNEYWTTAWVYGSSPSTDGATVYNCVRRGGVLNTGTACTGNTAAAETTAVNNGASIAYPFKGRY